MRRWGGGYRSYHSAALDGIFDFWMVSLGASFFDESFFPLVSKLTTDSYMEIHPEGRKGKKKGAYLMMCFPPFLHSPTCMSSGEGKSDEFVLDLHELSGRHSRVFW